MSVRLPNTINAKSDLYNIPLTPEEFAAGLEAILELAKGPRPVVPPGPGGHNAVFAGVFADRFRRVEEATKAQFTAAEGFSEIDRRRYDDTEFVFLRLSESQDAPQ